MPFAPRWPMYASITMYAARRFGDADLLREPGRLGGPRVYVATAFVMILPIPVDILKNAEISVIHPVTGPVRVIARLVAVTEP